MAPKKNRPLIFLSCILVVIMIPALMGHSYGEDQAKFKQSAQPTIASFDNTSYYEIMDWIIDGTHDSDMLFAGFNYSVFANIKNLDTLNHSNLFLTMISNSSYLILVSHVQNSLPCLNANENQTIFIGNVSVKKSVSTYERTMMTLYVTDDTIKDQEFHKLYDLRYYYLLSWSSTKWIPLDGDKDYDFECGESFAMDVNIRNWGMKSAFNLSVNISTYYGGRIEFWGLNRGRSINVLYPNQTVTLENTYSWRFTVKSAVIDSYEFLVLHFRISGFDGMTCMVTLRLNSDATPVSDPDVPSFDWLWFTLMLCTFLMICALCADRNKREVKSPFSEQAYAISAYEHSQSNDSNPNNSATSKNTLQHAEGPKQKSIAVQEPPTLEYLTEENQKHDIDVARLLGEQNFEKALSVLEAKRKNLNVFWDAFQGLNLTKTRSLLQGEMDRTRHEILHAKALCLQAQVNSATSLADYCTVGDHARALQREVKQFVVERPEVDSSLRSRCELLHAKLRELLEINECSLRFYQLEASYKGMHQNVVKKQWYGNLKGVPPLTEEVAALILDLKQIASKSAMQQDLLCAAQALLIKVEILPQQIDLKVSNLITRKNDPDFNQSVEDGFPVLKIAKFNLLGPRSCQHCLTERVDGAKYCPNCGEFLTSYSLSLSV